MKVYMVYMPIIKDEDGNIASFIKEVYSNKAAAYDAMRDGGDLILPFFFLSYVGLSNILLCMVIFL